MGRSNPLRRMGRRTAAQLEGLEVRLLLSSVAGGAGQAPSFSWAHATRHERHLHHLQHMRQLLLAQRQLSAAAVAALPSVAPAGVEGDVAASVPASTPAGTPNTLTFHGDAARTGFNQNETVLNPANVSSHFGQVWQSPLLDGKLYASPLYADNVSITSGGGIVAGAGKTMGVVFAATGGASVYAIKAFDTNGPTGIAPGTILWKMNLGTPSGSIDGNSIGVLGTPIIDLNANRIYVTASVTNPGGGNAAWEVFALNLSNGSILPGWPVLISQAVLQPLNRNNLNGTGSGVLLGPNNQADQRGALNLSADGSTLYVDFAAYGSSNGGWMVTVATGITNGVANAQAPAAISAYSGTNDITQVANGGMWGAGGPSIDAAGNVFVATGDSPGGTKQKSGSWGNSVLEWGPGQTLTLTGVYSPWNYQTQDNIDSDMGGSSPVIIQLPPGSSTTTELLVTGGKQGNGYLLNAGNHLNNPTAIPGSPASFPADLTKRPPGVHADQTPITPHEDPSLYDPNANRPYFSPAQPGPLSLFAPYSEAVAMTNFAKSRDTPAAFIGPDGARYVVWTGSSKTPADLSVPAAPSVVVTKIVTAPGQPAYLSIASQNTQVMSLPGASQITGDGTTNQIDWVVDAGVQRTQALSYSNGAPTLYAFDALTMRPLWSSAYGELNHGGKYNTTTVARGVLFAGTDRIQAFGLTTDTSIDDAVIGTGANQFNYVGSGWTHVPVTTGTATMGTFDGTVSNTSQSGDFATLTFTGSQIKVYANELNGYGSATISVDGVNAQTVSLVNPTGINSPNGQGRGNVLVYTASALGAGTHTLRFQNAGTGTVAIDRVVITPLATTAATLGVSITEGNKTPAAGGVLQYTINYDNAGSIINSGGVNATGVVLTETVPANTSYDAADSTPGWTLTSGSGGAGSTYTFAVGALSAGDAGSAIFAVTLNASLPAGTTNLTNTVTITDAAADTGSATRLTPVGAPAAYKLVFTQQPGNGTVGVAISPAIKVAVFDQYGNAFTSDTSSVTLMLGGSGGGTFSGGGTTRTVQAVNGVATFSNLAITSIGTYTLTAGDGALLGAASASFNVVAAVKLGFVQQPLGGSSGVAINPAVKVAVQDQNGATITGDGSTVTLTLASGTFANGLNSVSVQAVGGIATFDSLIFSTPGTYTLSASDAALTGATSNSFIVTAPASKLGFLQQPGNVSAGATMSPPVKISVQDSFGNVITGDNSSVVTLTLYSGGNPAPFASGSTTATATVSAGIATFSTLTISNPANYTLVASDGNLTTATSTSFAVGTPAATSIDDAARGTGVNQINYVGGVNGANWGLITGTSLVNAYNGTVTNDTVAGDTATVTFTNTQITFYAGLKNTRGYCAVSIDNGPETLIDLYVNDGTGFCAAVYTSPLLTFATHTLKVRVTGTPDPVGGGNTVSIDRFVVAAATPTITWPAPADIVYGTALSSTQLNATANVPGTFTYSPAAGTILTGGNNQPLSVSFVPTDTLHYNTANATVLLNVKRADEPLTWGPIADIPYGTALSRETQLDAFVPAPGHFDYYVNYGTPGQAVADGVVLPAGEGQIVTAVWTPDDTNKYNPIVATNDVDVQRATPTVAWANPADIAYGTPLGAPQLNASASAIVNGTTVALPGTFAYTPAPGTVLNAGANQALSVVFNPTDSTNYTTGIGTVHINVIIPAWLAGPSAATYNSNTHTLTVTGSATIVADPGAELPIINASGAGAQLTINPTSDQRIHLGGLNLSNQASVVLSSVGGSRSGANHRLLVVDAAQFSIDANSTLNLADNDMVLRNATASTANLVRQLILRGYAAAAWNGTGIKSSTAAGARTSLGYALNDGVAIASRTRFGPGASPAQQETVGATDFLIQYVLAGDANLDGGVDFLDLARMAQNYNVASGLFDYQGDFNFDGGVDFLDLAILAQNYNTSLPSSSSSVQAEPALAPVQSAATPTPAAQTSSPKPVFSAQRITRPARS
ncbi:MAG: hypothetical protein JWN40_2429 [Phycisphaerales bacterium]|nr:hypothetical protein [Phycisphaerales bacterium]